MVLGFIVVSIGSQMLICLFERCSQLSVACLIDGDVILVEQNVGCLAEYTYQPSRLGVTILQHLSEGTSLRHLILILCLEAVWQFAVWNTGLQYG